MFICTCLKEADYFVAPAHISNTPKHPCLLLDWLRPGHGRI